MSNQFDAKIIFFPIAWMAIDDRTNTVAQVTWYREGTEWLVRRRRSGEVLVKGITMGRNQEASARAKCRRFIEKLPDKP